MVNDLGLTATRGKGRDRQKRGGERVRSGNNSSNFRAQAHRHGNSLNRGEGTGVIDPR